MTPPPVQVVIVPPRPSRVGWIVTGVIAATIALCCGGGTLLASTGARHPAPVATQSAHPTR